MYALALNANPQSWYHFISRKTDASFKKLAQTVWNRDNFTCQYCGIHIKNGQEVINIDGCYTNNSLSNLVTACVFCVQCGFLESIGPGKYGGGTLIYLPEIEQTDLNGFCYALFQAMQQNTSAQSVAQQHYRKLSMRAQLVEMQLGTGMSDPAVFGQLLVESEMQILDNTFASHLRLLPMWAIFKEQIVNGIVYETM